MVFVIGLALIIAVAQRQSVEAISCYSCANVTSIPACTTTASCPDNWVCFSEYSTEQGNRLYTLGCKPQSSCPDPSIHSSSSIVGRASSAIATCTDCCSKGLCNKQLCQDNAGHCTDKTGVDCEVIGGVVDICSDISHIKDVCKRFCGLCNTVDGGWAAWSEWSSCDVTCGNGTSTKTRTCTDPSPENVGIGCPGIKQMHTACRGSTCPVHGGWSKWSEWGSCSVSCDVGLQRRDRVCSNPYPAYNGDHCFGESRDDRICFPGACANGSWSAWSSWSQCSTTCGPGTKRRSRVCDNPPPSIAGEYCLGGTLDITNCEDKSCLVFFHAKTLATIDPPSNGNLVFTEVLDNIGQVYNSTTGYFTAPRTGLYQFNIQLCLYAQKTLCLQIHKNNQTVKNSLFVRSDNYVCNPMSFYETLQKGNRISLIRGDASSSGTVFYQDQFRWNYFEGYLVR